MSRFVDLTGRRFGKLSVMYPTEKRQASSIIWHCMCDCGNEADINGNSLRRGRTKSCGCLRIEFGQKRGISNTTHQSSKTRLYKIWDSMKYRCNNINAANYERYGGRGIKVCNEWQEFEPFRDWAINNGYKDDLTLGRINVNGDYCPQNCRWATIKEQNNNQRTNRLFTVFGKTQTMTQWAEEYCISKSTLWGRLKRGWTIEEALTTPIKSKK